MVALSLEEFAPRVGKVTRLRDLWPLALEFFHARGAVMVSYHGPRLDLDTGAVRHAAPLVSNGFPESWVSDYVGQRLVRIDPIPAIAMATTKPFLWSDVARHAELSAGNLNYLAQLDRARLGNGLAVQVFGPMGRNGYVGLGFGAEMPDLGARDVVALQIAAQLSHNCYCAIIAERTYRRPALSEREREVLEWIARGKSNQDIAGGLSISVHTVNTLVRRLYGKLDVADRTTAALVGLGAGLIQI